MRTSTTIILKLVTSQDTIVLVTPNGSIASVHVLVWEEDGEGLPTLIPAQVVTAPVDGAKAINLVLASVVWSVILSILAPPQTSPLTVQVIRECAVEQEDTRKDGQLLF